MEHIENDKILKLLAKLDNNEFITEKEVKNCYYIERDDKILDNINFNNLFEYEETENSEWFFNVRPIKIRFRPRIHKSQMIERNLIYLVSSIKTGNLKETIGINELYDKYETLLCYHLDIEIHKSEEKYLYILSNFMNYINNNKHIIKSIRGYYLKGYESYFKEMKECFNEYNPDNINEDLKICSFHLVLNYVDRYDNLLILMNQFQEQYKGKIKLIDFNIYNKYKPESNESIRVLRNIYTNKVDEKGVRSSYITLNENDTVENIAKSFILQTSTVENNFDIKETLINLINHCLIVNINEDRLNSLVNVSVNEKQKEIKININENRIHNASIFDNILKYDTSKNFTDTALFFGGKNCVLSNDEMANEIYNFLIKFEVTEDWKIYNVDNWIKDKVLNHIFKQHHEIYKQNINNIFILFKWLKLQNKAIKDLNIKISKANTETAKNNYINQLNNSKKAVIKLENYINKYKKISFVSNNHYDININEEIKRKYKIYIHSFKDLDEHFYFIQPNETIKYFKSITQFTNYLNISRHTKLYDYIKNNVMIFNNIQDYKIMRLKYMYDYVLNEEELNEINIYSKRLLDLMKLTFTNSEDYETYIKWFRTKLNEPDKVINKNIISCPNNINETGHDSLKTYFKDRFNFIFEENETK
jgi:hypothetical protein